MFTTEATGTEPLKYQWEWKPPMDDSEWQPCDVEKFPGADTSHSNIDCWILTNTKFSWIGSLTTSTVADNTAVAPFIGLLHTGDG